MQHLYPAILTQQEQLHAQQLQKKLLEEKRKQEEQERQKARIALEKQRKVNEQRVKPNRNEEPKLEANPGEIFLPNDLEELKKRNQSSQSKKGPKGIAVGSNWKERKDSDETSEVDFDDNID